MNTTIAQKNVTFVAAGTALFAFVLFGVSLLTAHAAMISSQLDLGDRGQEVTRPPVA